MFMLESHLTTAQNRAVAAVQRVAADAHISVYLTGGAIRDMLGGFPIRDLDFTVEGDAIALSKSLIKSGEATLVSLDDNRKRVELLFPGGVTGEIGMARTEKFPKPGAKPQVAPATIHDDLRGRDFTVNAIALSLNRASRGLILDPVNGRSDLELKELRAVSNYGFYDDPIRLLRLIRYGVRLGFTTAEKTQRQYENAREAGMEGKIGNKALTQEIRHIAAEPNPGEVVRMLEVQKLLPLVSTVLTGPKLNIAGFTKLAKVRTAVPFGVDLHVEPLSLFLSILTENLTPKERSGVLEHLTLSDDELGRLQKLPTRAKKLEKDLLSSTLQRPSNLYNALRQAPGEQVLYLLMHSTQRLVQDRIRNYLQKYWPMAQEVTDQDVLALGIAANSPQFAKKKAELVNTRLNSRPKKVVPEEAPVAPVAVGAGRGR